MEFDTSFIASVPIIAGLLMSVLHVVSGPDHLAAVTPLAIESKKKSWLVGLVWGIGHVLGMLLLGLLFVLFKQYINIDIISAYGEQLVGFLLIAIGVWSVLRVIKSQRKIGQHSHPHAHNGDVHIHSHEHGKEHSHTHTHQNYYKQNIFTAMVIGIVHGVAGVSHIIAMLPSLALPDTSSSVLYLSGFAAGTILAMLIYALILGIIADRSAVNEKTKSFGILRLVGGVAAILVGVWWILLTVI